jgi:uroporphyrinogen decarboxylase
VTDTVFVKTIQRRNDTAAPPVWMMRQAGRYHQHYQQLRKQHGFVELCKNPDLAAEVAMGPIRDFDFDSAILFSDILFPIEVMGPSLVFDPGPKFSYHLKTIDDINKYQVTQNSIQHLKFQECALKKTREILPLDKSLIGFVGGALTLYIFAVHGTHKTDLSDAKQGFLDGRFEKFLELLTPLIIQNMVLQAKAGCDLLAIFESCAGDIEFTTYRDIYLPFLRNIMLQFKVQCPDTKVLYYAKNTGIAHWHVLSDLPIDVLGIDHHQDIKNTMDIFSDRFAIQGNFDPDHLTLPHEQFLSKADHYFKQMSGISSLAKKGWICGLGHGVTPFARQENVKTFVKMARGEKI